MPCYHPLKAYRGRTVNPATGKRNIVFKLQEAFHDLPIELPCGRCIGCRLERSRQWAIRCVHEASLYENNCFITLTYSDENLPPGGVLHMKHFQDFMKRLRKKFGPKIRFFHCGEYGEKFKRPHYHACLFNHDFHDKEFWKKINGNDHFRSPALESLWEFGHSTISALTFNSAAYVARYITKKITGPEAETHYEYLDEYGEYKQRPPEYITMSRRPGIAKGWLEKHTLAEVYPSDYIILRGKKMKPPKFYDKQFELAYPSDFLKTKIHRQLAAMKNAANNTDERLMVREECTRLRLKQLKRSYEND